MIRIEPGTAASLPAILAMLPQSASHRTCHWGGFADEQIVAAGSLHWQGQFDPAGFTARVFVRPAWRRRGIGRQLLAVIAAAAEGETDGLWSAEHHADDTDAAAFLAALGFAPAQRDLHFQMSGLGFVTHMDAIVDRLRRAGRIPDDVATPTLRDAPLAATAQLVADEFRQPPARVLRQLELARHDPVAARLNPDVSTVVIEQGQVVGVLLAAIDGDVGRIDCNVVAPHRRRSWVNVVQLQVTTRRGLAFATHIAFHCDAQLRDSVNLATRAGGQLMFSAARYWRAA